MDLVVCLDVMKMLKVVRFVLVGGKDNGNCSLPRNRRLDSSSFVTDIHNKG